MALEKIKKQQKPLRFIALNKRNKAEGMKQYT